MKERDRSRIVVDDDDPSRARVGDRRLADDADARASDSRIGRLPGRPRDFGRGRDREARLQHYGVFVVDVETPGMDGFEFVTTTRADPELRTTPANLVTSRAAPEDLRRGRDAGASAYIVKGEFDQGTLLTTMRSLLKPDAP